MSAKNGCQRLIRAINLPHYENTATKPETLALLRQLLRKLHQFPLPLVRDHLSHMTVHAFHGCMYTTSPLRINALLQIARGDLALLRRALDENDFKAMESILHRAFTSYRVSNSPFFKLLKPILHIKHSVVPQKLLGQILESGTCMPKTAAWRFNNIETPNCKSYDEHDEMIKQRRTMFAQYVHFLNKHNIKRGHSRRKLVLKVDREYTALGQLVASCRQRNLLKKNYAALLRDAPKPVDPSIITCIDEARNDVQYSRMLRRRLQKCAETLYSVDDKGGMIRSNIFALTGRE